MENKDEKQRFCTSTKCSVILGVIILVAIAIVCVVTFVDKDLRQKVQYDSGDLEWWKTTIVYQIYPRSFQDSDGDGTGDLRGIISRLGHFTYLNIGAIWISPFYESPMRDFGYDVKNFTKIDPINDSMWFQKSRNLVDPYTDYYIWSDGKPVSHNTSVPPFNREPPNNWKAFFGGSAWTWDDHRQQYYYHAFLDSQPDLNYRNKAVKKEMLKAVFGGSAWSWDDDAMRFWLNKGVAGFRLDALKFMYETTNTSLNDPDCENVLLCLCFTVELYDYMYLCIIIGKYYHAFLNNKTAIYVYLRFMIAESYGLTLHMRDEYYKAGSVPFNFALISRLNKTCGGECIKDIVHDSVVGLPDNAWPNFVMGNHDNHRISDRLGMDMVNAFNMLLLTLPGTPTTYYGEEIGMEDTEYSYKELKDPYGINNKRSPMQWNSSGNAGFTTGKPWLRINANYQTLNVEIQKTSKKVTTLLVYKKLAELRQTPSFQNSDIKFGPTDENVFSYVRSALGRPKYFIIINFGQSKTTGDYSMDPVGSSKGDVVISATDSVNDLYRVGDIIDLTSITLERGQGLVILKKTFCTSVKCSLVLALVVLVFIAVVCVITFLDKNVREKVQYDSSDLVWWKKTIIYQIYPRSFQDSDGDGIGDLNGIKQRLGHFKYLNVDTVWISPFYKSPMRDFGYDVTNYTEIDPMFGNVEDFDDLLKKAKAKGIRIIMDFVPNHTSNDSYWFQQSRLHAEPYKDYYIWDDGKLVKYNTTVPPYNRVPPNNWKSVFGGPAWTWDVLRGQYYYHAFLDSQPDLDFRNEKVRVEIKYDNYTIFDDSKPLMISESYGMTAETIQHYYQAGAVPFNFDLITQLNKSCGGYCIRGIVTGAMNNLPEDAWPSFVIGNHDKHRISDRLGKEMVDAMNILLLTLPGTPTTYMGEEIGMEDVDYNLTEVKDPYGKKHPDKFREVGRDPERSPMQWNNTMHAGFTTGNPWLRPSFQNRNITTGVANDNVFSYVRTAYGRPKYLITINFGHESSTDDYSQKPFQMKTGEIVVKTNNFNSNDYSIGKSLDLKSIKLDRGQGLAQMKGDGEQTSTLKIYKALAKLRQQPSFQNRNITTGVVNDNVFSYVRTAYGRPKYLITINFGHESSTDDYSQKPFQMKTGEIVVKTNNFNSNDYSIGKSLDLKSIKLDRGQGLVLYLNNK
ncbi:hypothetical protein KUTeg_024531 [Tegillarca granosa]|uniref:Glycosyl hydrolase family 13 catalytic domain-containing protein n=1 Tax=Tegillarca granosa TaxID=220873 RepID=A0ABQ9E3C0_TEGGR|nr:hypothetical protein KUTeg_024531 [Tegillarca granosa]